MSCIDQQTLASQKLQAGAEKTENDLKDYFCRAHVHIPMHVLKANRFQWCTKYLLTVHD